MSRWIRVYDREARELVTKEEFDRRRAARSKPCHFDFKQKMERGHWAYDKETRTFRPITEVKRKEVELPFVQTDEIPPTLSHATDEGLVFTSKRKLYDHYKAHGMVVREKGMNARPPEPYKPDPREIREQAAKALNDLRYGNVPVSEKERECNKREQRALEEFKRRMH